MLFSPPSQQDFNNIYIIIIYIYDSFIFIVMMMLMYISFFIFYHHHTFLKYVYSIYVCYYDGKEWKSSIVLISYKRTKINTHFYIPCQIESVSFLRQWLYSAFSKEMLSTAESFHNLSELVAFVLCISFCFNYFQDDHVSFKRDI